MIKAVIFDFDGTIIDTESLWYDIYKEYFLSSYNYHLPLELFGKFIGTDAETLFLAIEEDLGQPLERTKLISDLNHLFEKNLPSLEMRDGIVDIIKRAIESDKKIAIATSSNIEWVERLLNHFGIGQYFTIMITRDFVEKVKPDPALYKLAVEKLNVMPTEAIAIEDSRNGAIAAIRAGLNCIVVPNRVTKYSTFPEDCVIKDSFQSIDF